MKILFGFIAILFIAATYIFVTQEDSLDDTSPEETIVEELNSKNTMHEKTNTTTKNKYNSTTKQEDDDRYPTREDEREMDTEIPESEENQMTEADLEDFNDREDEDVPEYSEEVSSEDFKEFIGIAIEELDSGDELAEAIITEMIKIAQAQPDHIEQVKNFYQVCSQKSDISTENQELCLKYLETLNEQ